MLKSPDLLAELDLAKGLAVLNQDGKRSIKLWNHLLSAIGAYGSKLLVSTFLVSKFLLGNFAVAVVSTGFERRSVGMHM